MNLYADPSRPCPEGWTLARTPNEARALLATGAVRRVAIGIDTGPTARAFRRLVSWMDRTGHWPSECASVHGHMRSAWAIRETIRRHYGLPR